MRADLGQVPSTTPVEELPAPSAGAVRAVPSIVSVAASRTHDFSKQVLPMIRLVEGLGTVLGLGDTAEVRLTGLRNPCSQIDADEPHRRLEKV